MKISEFRGVDKDFQSFAEKAVDVLKRFCQENEFEEKYGLSCLIDVYGNKNLLLSICASFCKNSDTNDITINMTAIKKNSTYHIESDVCEDGTGRIILFGPFANKIMQPTPAIEIQDFCFSWLRSFEACLKKSKEIISQELCAMTPYIGNN